MIQIKRNCTQSQKDDGSIFEWQLMLNVDFSFRKTPSTNFVKNNSLLTRQIITNSIVRPASVFLEDSLSYFRSYSNIYLRRIFGEQLVDNRSEQIKESPYPEYSISLKHIYGLESYGMRDAIFYLPRFDKTQVREIHRNSKKRIRLMGPSQNALKKLLEFKPSVSSNNVSDQSLPSQTPDDSNISVDGPSLISATQAFKKYSTIENNFMQKERKTKRITMTIPEAQRKTISQNQKDPSSIYDIVNEFDKNQAFEDNGKNYINFFNQEDTYLKRSHREFSKDFVFTASRFAILTSSDNTKTQKFYEGHKFRISAIAVHPLLFIVATGEVNFRPQIQVWHPLNCFNISTIKTFHNLGIVVLKFSNKGNLLISVSVDSSTSIQVSNWKTGQMVAFRNTTNQKIIDLAIDPLDPNCFVTSSINQIDLWCLKGLDIILFKAVKFMDFSSSPFITTVNYITYDYVNELRNDILVSTSTGYLGLVRDFKVINRVEHAKGCSINVVKLVSIDSINFVFVASDSPTLSIYDMNLHKQSDILIQQKICDANFELGLQSMDIWVEDSVTNVILGTKDGFAIEVSLSWAQKHDKQLDKKSKITSVWEFSDEGQKVLIKAHSSQNNNRYKNEFDFVNYKQVFITLHHKHPILISVGDDGYISFWDTETSSLALLQKLPAYPTTAKFSPDSNYLVIGLVDGRILIYEPKIFRSSNRDHTFFSVNINEDPIILKDNDIESPVLNIEFSLKGDFMAVSHDGVRETRSAETFRKESGGSIVIVYILQSSHKKVARSKNQRENLYQKYTEVRLTSVNYADVSKMSYLGLASYFMTFSDDDNYLMLYYQSVNDFHIRENNDREGKYIVWNLRSNTTEINWEVLRNAQFRSAVFPSHVHGRRQYQSVSGLAEAFDPKRQDFSLMELDNNGLTISTIANYIGVTLLGSVTGELFLVNSYFSQLNSAIAPESLSLDKLYQAKRYPAHASFVNQIEIASTGKFFFTTSVSDECIFQWEIQKTEIGRGKSATKICYNKNRTRPQLRL